MVSQLKSLELQGYKTFANRTVFDFTSPISAIIGPNGSGKSNIADSIRWVLGEQSYSLLRGKKTEDMIFSGSEQRSRASMASATMVFDNSDDWLPIDFSEVAVTRRAYRDGQNEYLINGKRVRLKDVSELLAQSGLAERTYTIIGQGLVDAALALKAEERRRLFEEAAGIGLYRTRREEAIRRLEVTRRNLERVQDILAELQPRLKSLERQSRRLQEYEQIKADLRILLVEWYGYHWHNAQAELAKLSELVDVRERAYNKVHHEQIELEKKISEERIKTVNYRDQLNDYHRSLSQFYQQRESLTRDKAVVEERIIATNNRVQTSQHEINRLQEEEQLHKKVLADISNDLKELENDLKDAQEHAAATHEALLHKQNKRLEIEQGIVQKRKIYNGLVSQKVEMSAIVSNRKAQIEQHQSSLVEIKNQIENSNSKIGKSRARLTSLEKNLAQQQKIKSKLEGKLHTLIKARERFEEKIKDRNMERQNSNADLAKWITQLELIAQAENVLTGYSDGVKVIRESLEKGQLSGVHGFLGKSIQVPARYETAIAAALGEYINAIILDSTQSMDTALDVLVGRSSRGILFPSEVLLVKNKRLPQGKDGFIGCASELVEVSKEFIPVLEAILGNVFIVEDRYSARSLLDTSPAEISAVTLNGEVFHKDGSVITGTEGKNTVIGRSRQIQNLKTSINEAEQQLRMLDGEIKKIQDNLIVKEGEAGHLQIELNNLIQEMQTSTAELTRENRTCEQLSGELNWQEVQLQGVTSEISRYHQEIIETEQKLADIQVTIIKVEAEIGEQSDYLKRVEVTEDQEQFIHWNAVVKVSERACNDTRFRLEEHQINLTKIQQQLADDEQNMADLADTLRTLEKESESVKQKEERVATLVSVTQEKLAPTEAQLHTAEKNAEALTEEDKLVKKRLVLQESQFSQARINLARQQERFESLSRRIEDDFGLVDFEYDEKVSGPTPLPLDGMVQKLPRVQKISSNLEENIKENKVQLRRIGSVNPEARAEYEEVNSRYNFMTEQVSDLEKAETDVRHGIIELDAMMQQEFQHTFERVSQEFVDIFGRLFEGGSANLVLTDPSDLTGTGIDIEARLPGKRAQGLSLLSGGERSLTATALIFALLKVSPTPFCLLDEVDAMLDEANVDRFSDLVNELSKKTQFIIVTHNRNTVQVADVIYGVTMGRDSASQVISLKLEDIEKVI
jgi:chromosome segregation protein